MIFVLVQRSVLYCILYRKWLQVLIINPTSVGFGETVKEAEIGSNLILNVELKGSSPHGLLTFTDCRQIPWTIHSDDEAIFTPVTQYEAVIPTRGTGCGTVELKAKAVGDTAARISFDKLQAEVEIAAYAPLKASLDSAALAVGSSYPIKVTGGPRPWLLDPSEYFQEGKNHESAAISFTGNSEALLSCESKPAQQVLYFLHFKGL